MANPEHLEILKKGVQSWNKWRRDNPEIQPDLSKANLSRRRLSKLHTENQFIYFDKLIDLSHVNLSETDLSQAVLSVANLSGANLAGANLIKAELWKADLARADLSSARLFQANLQQSNLFKANLRNAILTMVDFTKAFLDGADFSFAGINGTIFGNNDLCRAKGLDSVRHIGPSTIGIDTLYKSAGKIPEIFLRGCGVPDDFITFIPAHFGLQQAIQFYSCFISYSTKDEEFARRLYSRMRDEHLRVWFAPEDIKGGQKLQEQIERAIQLHDRLLLVLSENSMQSEWVISEIHRARKTEIEENRRKLFPITIVDFDKVKTWKCFDTDAGKDLAKEVREYFIPDFSNWKDHDAFEKAFDRLLRDLKAEEKKDNK
jgi:hypothetical protein